MTDNWRYFPCTVGDEQAFIYVDVGLADSIAQAPAALATVALAYKAPRPDGLPTHDEFEAVRQIEDTIEAFLVAPRDWYVGRVTVAGHRHFYVYTDRDESVWRDYVARLREDSGYEIELSFSNDPDHSGYLNELYPSADDWQVIRDIDVIENLKQNGDDGTALRQVDHWIYFPDEAASEPFVAWAEGNGFTHDKQYSHPTNDGRYCVRLHHQGTMKIADISNRTIALRRNSIEYNGDYDGWETPVIKSDD